MKERIRVPHDLQRRIQRLVDRYQDVHATTEQDARQKVEQWMQKPLKPPSANGSRT